MGDAVAMTVRQRVDLRDRPWVDAYVGVICGPFDMPSLGVIRDAVTTLADKYPDSRLTWSLDSAKEYWRNDRPIESVVVEREWPEGLDLGARLGLIAADEHLDPPLTIIRYPNHIGLKMCHAIGDGRMFITAFCATMYTAILGEAIDWPVEPAPPSPLLSAALKTFGRKPLSIKAAFADRPEIVVEDTVEERRPWTPSQRTDHSQLTGAQVSELYGWREQFAPGASMYCLQIACVLGAFEKVGLQVSEEVRVIADLRRYLGWRFIEGNFVAGVPMIIDSRMTPGEISAAIRATNKSGRPLAGYALAMMYARGRRMPSPTSVNSRALPRVAFTSIGRSDVVDGLPFLPDRPIDFTGSVPPEGPLGMTLLLGETSRSMGMAATYHDNVVDPVLVAEAMRLISEDPVALLSSKGGSA